MLTVEPDGTVTAKDGRILLFGLERFLSDIVRGNCCFICGARPDSVPFNDEHILPDWILRRYKLHDKLITLPNGTTLRHGQYKIPCCADCNEMMGERLEKPLREVFHKGYEAFSEHLQHDGPWTLFCWMCLIFLKTHLKDRNLRFNQDKRQGDELIGDLHSWEDLHHIHCMARAFYTECELKVETLGSLLVLPAKTLPYVESFDYCDLSLAQTMLIRIDEIAIVTVFNDSNASLNVFQEHWKKLAGRLSPLQLREVAARLATINLHLSERPRFASSFNAETEEYSIEAERPAEIDLIDYKREILGKIMHSISADMLKGAPQEAEVLEGLKTGRYTFLLDSNGRFIADHMEER